MIDDIVFTTTVDVMMKALQKRKGKVDLASNRRERDPSRYAARAFEVSFTRCIRKP